MADQKAIIALVIIALLLGAGAFIASNRPDVVTSSGSAEVGTTCPKVAVGQNESSSGTFTCATIANTDNNIVVNQAAGSSNILLSVFHILNQATDWTFNIASSSVLKLTAGTIDFLSSAVKNIIASQCDAKSVQIGISNTLFSVCTPITSLLTGTSPITVSGTSTGASVACPTCLTSNLNSPRTENVYEYTDNFDEVVDSCSTDFYIWDPVVASCSFGASIDANHFTNYAMSTSSTSGNNAHLLTFFGVPITSNVNFTYIFRIVTITSVTVAIGDSTSPTAATLNGVVIFFDPTVNGGKFQCRVGNGVSMTSVDTGTAAVAGTYYKVTFTHDSTPEWKIYLNGALKCTITTNLPTNDQLFVPTIITNSAAVKTLDLDWFHVRLAVTR